MLGFHSSSFIEEFLGEDVLGYKDDGASKSAENAEYISGELNGAGEDDAKSEWDKREVGGRCVVNVVDKAVGEDGEQRGEAFDGVDKRDGDLFRSGGGEDMSADLEEGERKGCSDYVAGRVANAILEDWDGCL